MSELGSFSRPCMNPHGCLAQKSGLVILPLFGVTPPLSMQDGCHY